jgi:hypothetical protein
MSDSIQTPTSRDTFWGGRVAKAYGFPNGVAVVGHEDGTRFLDIVFLSSKSEGHGFARDALQWLKGKYGDIYASEVLPGSVAFWDKMAKEGVVKSYKKDPEGDEMTLKDDIQPNWFGRAVKSASETEGVSEDYDMSDEAAASFVRRLENYKLCQSVQDSRIRADFCGDDAPFGYAGHFWSWLLDSPEDKGSPVVVSQDGFLHIYSPQPDPIVLKEDRIENVALTRLKSFLMDELEKGNEPWRREMVAILYRICFQDYLEKKPASFSSFMDDRLRDIDAMQKHEPTITPSLTREVWDLKTGVMETARVFLQSLNDEYRSVERLLSGFRAKSGASMSSMTKIQGGQMDFRVGRKAPRQTSKAPGVYLTQDRSMANAYANGRVSDAHMGAGEVRNGVVFMVVLDEEERHVPGDVWKGGFADEFKGDLKAFLTSGQMGNLGHNLLEAAGIHPPYRKDFIQKLSRNPDSILGSISPSEWSSMQNGEMGYSEVVLPELPWNKIVEAYLYDADGRLEKTIRGGTSLSEEEIADAEAEGRVFWHGSPRSFWRKLGKKQSSSMEVTAKGKRLFHGTDRESAASILSDGIDMSKSQKGYFGRGFYLAEDRNLAQSNYADLSGGDKGGEVLEFVLSPNARILDLRNAKDADKFVKMTWGGRKISDQLYRDDLDQIMVALGVDALFDQSFGGYVVYNPAVLNLVDPSAEFKGTPQEQPQAPAAEPPTGQSAEPPKGDTESVTTPVSKAGATFSSSVKTSSTDEAYLDAIHRGDTAMAQKMIDDAAKEKGYLVGPVYHGTTTGPFKSFDLGRSGRNMGEHGAGINAIMFTDNADIAASYASPGNRMTADSNAFSAMQSLIAGRDQYEAAVERARDQKVKVELGDDGWEYTIIAYDQWGSEYKYYSDFIYDTEKEAQEAADGEIESQVQKAQTRLDDFLAKEEEQLKRGSQVVRAYLRMTRPAHIDYGGNTVDVGDISQKIKAAREAKKDGLILSNAVDPLGQEGQPSTIYVVFSPSQIKSAEPATYDERGDVVIPSSRFDPSSHMIASSVKVETVKEAKKAAGVMKNWFKTALETEDVKVPVQPTQDEIDSLAKILIRKAWNTGMLPGDEKYDAHQVELIVDNEVGLSNLSWSLAGGDENVRMQVSEAIRKELIRLEEILFRRRSKKVEGDPLSHIRGLVRGKTWEQAKKAIDEMRPPGKHLTPGVKVSDEEAEEYFSRLYATVFSAGYPAKAVLGRSPYLRDDGTRYIKRMSEMCQSDPRAVSEEKRSHEDYLEASWVAQQFGYGEKMPAAVEIYRGVSRPDTVLRPGDHVTTNRTYARWYMRGKYGAIIRDTVSPDDLIVYKIGDFDQDEFVYFPREAFAEAIKSEEDQPEIKPPMTFRKFWELTNEGPREASSKTMSKRSGSKDWDVSLECVCADDFGSGYKDDPTDEDKAQIQRYDETVEAHQKLKALCEARVIRHYIADTSDRSSRHSDAYLYFPWSRLREVLAILKESGVSGDILDVPSNFPADYSRYAEGELGWGVERHFRVAPKSKFANAMSDDDMYSVHEKMMDEYDDEVSNIVRSFLEHKKKSRWLVPWEVVPAARIIKIWRDYSITGVVHDERGMDDIAQRMVRNTMRLRATTEMSGHSQIGIRDVLESAGYELTDKQIERLVDGLETKEGAWFVSDYGLPKLEQLAVDLTAAKTSKEQLLITDQMLDVIHQRGDLSAMFIEGGRKTLSGLFLQ